MNSNLSEIFEVQERKLKNCITRDYQIFNANYKNQTGFAFLETGSKEYELQKYFEVRLEHYIRTILINDVMRLILEDRGVGIYQSEIPEDHECSKKYFTNREYEAIAGYEFVADYGDATVMYRYTDISQEMAENLLTDFEDQLVIINWDKPVQKEIRKDMTLANGKKICYRSLYDLFEERIGNDEYEDFIIYLTGVVIEFQEFIGVKSVPKLSPFSLGTFRLEVEEEFKSYIQKIYEYMKADDKISAMAIDGIDGINYGYRVIDDENKQKYKKAEDKTKELLKTTDILKRFDCQKVYRYLIGRSDFAKSFITSEYLYKQYDCDDCFDYTAVVSGYLKSIEQLLYHIANFSKGKGYKIKNNGQKNKDGVYPPSVKSGKVYKIDFVEENDGCFDTTIGSLIHFLDDNKSDLLLVDDCYKKAIIDCLNCYRIECRNDSFHLDNNYSWSRVEFIRWNTFLVYILLFSCCKLGDTEWQTQNDLKLIKDDRLERLYSIVASGKKGIFEFHFMGDGYMLEPIKVRHITDESSYPSYDSVGQIKSIFLTFESVSDQHKVIIMRRNVPEEIYFIDENGKRIKIE